MNETRATSMTKTAGIKRWCCCEAMAMFLQGSDGPEGALRAHISDSTSCPAVLPASVACQRSGVRDSAIDGTHGADLGGDHPPPSAIINAWIADPVTPAVCSMSVRRAPYPRATTRNRSRA
jgi:hypothetical protein